MKIGYRDIDYFIKSPPAEICAILLYGPDQGLVKERAKQLAKTVVEDLNDAFMVSELSNETLEDNPERLNDEAHALSMMGGKRLIRVYQADDKAAQACKGAFDNFNGDSLTIIEAGELGPKSALRGYFEKGKNIAALPCYVEDGRNLEHTIKDIIAGFDKTIQRDALAFLCMNLKGDRMLIRSEIEKLCLYAGTEKHITLDDCLAAIGARGETGFNEITFAVAGGDIKTLDKRLNQAFEEGFPPPALIRAVQNHFKRLYQAKLFVEQGKNAKEAMESIHPKVFFKEQPAFQAQMNRWHLRAIEKALAFLIETEKQSKMTALPAEIICAQSFTRLANFKN